MRFQSLDRELELEYEYYILYCGLGKSAMALLT